MSGTSDALFEAPQRNFAPRTIWTGDNLDILRGLNSETIDLIYLDPPFNSNRTYSAPIGSRAAGAAFEDTWTLDREDVAWMGMIADQHPGVHNVVMAAGTHSTGMQSYLRMMAVRLLEMRRVLAPTGSIYLHCDPTASHYLKMLMDAVFRPDRFRNEIVWQRTSAHSDGSQGRRQFGRNCDVILFYTTSRDEWTWNAQHTEYDQGYLDGCRVEPETGRRYRLSDITGPGAAAKGNPRYEVMGVTRYWRYSRQKMQQLIAEGRVVQSAPGRVPRYKRYLDEMPGRPVQALWDDINPVGSHAKERIGYPTQKPLALLTRIIEASSDPGDVVLDPFCGCATACVAADNLSREWVGIDISPKAVELVHMRLREALGSLYHHRLVTARNDIPQRTDIDVPINYRQNKHVLFGEQEGRCKACQLELPFKLFEVDHVIARSRGGSDHIGNLQLLCGSCNRIKGDRSMEYLMAELKKQAA